MMSSGMKESKTNTIELDVETDVGIFKEVLKYIYCGRLPSTLDENAFKLLPFADQYDLKYLKDACLRHMEKDLSKGLVRHIKVTRAFCGVKNVLTVTKGDSMLMTMVLLSQDPLSMSSSIRY